MIRPLLPAFLLLLLLPTALVAPPARADEGPDEGTKARADAEHIGRELIAPDAARRRQAMKRLLALGADDATLDLVGAAARAWANDPERLVEMWMEQMLEGDADTRRRAARLLHAAGPQVIERFARELRHLRHHGAGLAAQQLDIAQDEETAQTDTPPAPQQAAQQGVVALPQFELRTYAGQTLMDRGLTPLQIRSFLQKKANASEVKEIGDLYLVLARPTDHEALTGAIADLTTEQAKEEAEPAPRAEATRDLATADDAGADVATPATPKARKPAPAAMVQKKVAPQNAWRLTPLVVQVPREEAQAFLEKEKAAASDGVFVRTGSREDAARWLRQARRLPDARALLQGPALHVVPVAGNVHSDRPGATILAAKPFTYNRGVRRQKGGAYAVETDTLTVGYRFDFNLIAMQGEAPTLLLACTHTHLERPVPNTRYKPAKDAPPVQIDQPAWSRTTTTVSATAPPAGGAVLIGMDALEEKSAQDLLVVVIPMEPPGQGKAVAAQEK